MFSLSRRSQSRMDQAHPGIQHIFMELLREYDYTVICTHRGEKDQNAAYYAVPQNSQVKWPNSKHNSIPSKAIDVVPYPYGWDSIKQFYFMAGRIESIAFRLGYNLRWGGNWDDDTDLDDNGFMDLAHWELI